MRHTKIICTLGPASSTDEVIGALIDAGMNVARLNFSHGSHADHQQMFERVRRVAAERDRSVAVMQDLQGPKIRVGLLPEGAVLLAAGERIGLVARAEVSAKEFAEERLIPHSYGPLASDARAGDTILLDDGRITLTVSGTKDDRVIAEVLHGGKLAQRKGMNLPGMALSVPALTEKDRADLVFGKALGVDYVALSFVRAVQDVIDAQLLADGIPIIAKIEKPEAIADMESIVEASDGVMVARGDLGVEMPAEQVPLLQKRLVELCNKRGKVGIIATEMLDSMRFNPRPTRAEVSDVANAILDGTDAVMLSGETAVGAYPVEAVKAMDRVVLEIEQSARYQEQHELPTIYFRETTNAIARAAVAAAQEVGAKTILCYTETGDTARRLSDHRPVANIVAGTNSPVVYRRMALEWGVSPLLMESCPLSTEGMINTIGQQAIDAGYAKRGEMLVLIFGSRSDGASDLIKIQQL